MDSDKTYCEICDARFSGSQPALQHFSSEKHKKKERQRRDAQGNIQSMTYQETLENLPEKEFEFSGFKGICYVCKKELTSAVVASQHLAGKNHKKAKERWERMKQDRQMLKGNHKPTIVGTLSSGALSSIITEDSSLLLKQKLKAGSETRKFDSAPVSTKSYAFDITKRSGCCFACKKDINNFADLQKHLKEDTHLSNEKEWYKNPDAKRLDLQEEMDTSSTCGSSGSSPPPVAISIHPSNPLDNTKWFLCEVCDIRVNTTNQLKIHQQSPKHIKQTERRRSGTAVSPGMADQTLWYTCNVCDKKLNSEDQLIVHKRSHGIKDDLPRRPLISPVSRIGLGAPDDTSLDTVDNQYIGINHKSSPKVDIPIPLAQNTDIDSIRRQRLRYFGGKLDFESEQSFTKVPSTAEVDVVKGLQKLDMNKINTPLLQEQPKRSTSSNWSQGWILNGERKSPSSIISAELDHRYAQSKTISEPTRFTEPIKQEEPVHIAEVPNSAQGRDSIASVCRTAKPTRDRKECKIFGCTNHCDICDKHHTGDKPYSQHLKSKGHQKKEAELKNEAEVDDGKLFPTFRLYCELCKVPFDTEASAEAHYEGKKHMEKFIKATKVPDRALEPVRKNLTPDECDSPYDLVKTVPRSYQVELYEKAMERDVVCFLPTGTGKTLVSVMVLSHMLEMNPSRPVVFLVDKVLLAFQQCKVIKAELEDKKFERYDEEEKKLVERSLRISLVCGGKQDTQGRPIWQQDVIIATAAYFENLLMHSIVRWEDQCLVILDESHHCVKDHPYQRVMRDYHAAIPDVTARPKVLGLTASPAGRHDLPQTKEMLGVLLENLGHVSMAAVEHDNRELKKYRSNTKLIIRKVNLSQQEEKFEVELQKYILTCYQRMVAETNVEEYLQNRELHRQLPGDAENNIPMDVVQDLLDVIDTVEAKHEGNKIYVESLKSHMKVISSAVLTVRGMGVSFACEDMETLNKEAYPGSFSHAKEMRLACEPLMTTLAEYKKQKSMLIEPGEEMTVDSVPVIKQLIQEILDQVDWEKGQEDPKERPMVLVLVRQRKCAKTLENILNEVPEIKAKGIKSVCVVGHAAKTSEGMSVRQQDRVMLGIKDHEYQVIVGTSIAEEGLDFPECELVVQMDPPNNVKSLVQIRGRARKKNSRFVALCRDDGQANSLENLQLREGYMIDAVTQIVEAQNREDKMHILE